MMMEAIGKAQMMKKSNTRIPTRKSKYNKNNNQSKLNKSNRNQKV